VTLSFRIAAATGNEWTSVSTTLGGSTATLLSSTSALTLQLPSAASGQLGTLSFALSPHATVFDAEDNPGLTPTTLQFTAPAVGSTAQFTFSVRSEAGSTAAPVQLTIHCRSNATEWSAAVKDGGGIGADAWSSDAQPTVTVPYALRDTAVAVQVTLLSPGASLFVDGISRPNGTLTLHAPATGLTDSAPIAFTVQAEDSAVEPVAYTLRLATAGNTDAGWFIDIHIGDFRTALTIASPIGQRSIELPADARSGTVQLSVTLPEGATVATSLPLTGGNASITAPATAVAQAEEFSFSVTAQDGTTHSGTITLSFTVAAGTGNGWTSVSTMVGGLQSTLLVSDSASAPLRLPLTAAGEMAVLSFVLDPYAYVLDGSGAAGPSSGSLLVLCPTGGKTSNVSFSVVSESGAAASYVLQLLVTPSNDSSWMASISGGSAFDFSVTLSSESNTTERTLLLPSSARGLPFELQLQPARNATVSPATATQSVSLTAPASASSPALEYSFIVTAEDGVTTSGPVKLRFEVAPLTDRGVTIVASVAAAKFTSAALIANSPTEEGSMDVRQLSLLLPAAAASLNVTLTFSLQPFASLADGAPRVQQLTAAAVGGSTTLNFSVVAESGAVQSYTLHLPVGLDDQRLNDGGEESGSTYSSSERRAMILVPAVIGGVFLVLLATFALYRSMRQKDATQPDPAPSAFGGGASGTAPADISGAWVSVAATEMASLPSGAAAAATANNHRVTIHMDD
jgi:hypothetical protein